MTTSTPPKHRLPLIALGSALTVTAAWLLYPVIFPNSSPIASPAEKNSRPLNTSFMLPPAPASATAEPIRLEIQSAIDPKTPSLQRTELIQTLPETLSEAEYRILLREVIMPPSPGTPEAWHSSHIHEICKLLQRIPDCHDLLADTLATVAASRDFSEVYRDCTSVFSGAIRSIPPFQA